ncbi:acyl-CoA desaturase [Thioalkalivibrio sp. ALgr3]|uniref:acyl-CoA desaturase n=1 Tax=Thioalkalivibrio sp. ALgr3 TaxID=1239292 RepID=UPI00037B9F00|nr:acyl-CoA desaturase [Thioalkalivibrio sp. ALgr3]
MSEPTPPIARTTAIFFLASNLAALTLVPWWGLTQGFSGAAWAFFGIFMVLGGLGITVGYHRLWAHRSFKARGPLRVILALCGALALQNSIYNWSARHRVHHGYVDDVDRDPHSIRRGFWHAHMGWMLRNWPASRADYSRAKDLTKDPVVMWQHRHYWTLVWGLNLGLPLLLGLVFGDVIGMLLLAGVLRLVLSHHFTFFINSLAHWWGWRPYSDENTAVDNGLVALLTWGEGYHNFHHAFQADYRNGVRWWQYDPSKWLINLLAWTGLVHDRRWTPRFKILRARLHTEFRRLLNSDAAGPVHDTWRATVEREYQHFRDTVNQWQQVQADNMRAGREALNDRWLRTELRTRFKELEYRLKMQRRRLRALSACQGTASASA